MAPLRHAAAGRVPEIADLGGVRTAALADSPWWAGLRRRLTPIGQAPAGRASGTLDATLEKLESAAATRLAFATWHGDWGPWNLRSTPGRLLVWDWERSGDGVPLGFDLLHFGYQTALPGLGQPAAVAAATARDRATPLLAELGQQRGRGVAARPVPAGTALPRRRGRGVGGHRPAR